MFDDIPLGHSISSHVVHGWCGLCRGHSALEELEKWRVWSMTNVAEVAEKVARNGART